MKRFIILIIITSCAASSCRKDDFDNYWYMVSCIYDGTPCSYKLEDKSFLFWGNNPGDMLHIDRRNDTTFIYSPMHCWNDTPDLHGYINLIDEEHPVIPNEKLWYELKKGLLFPKDSEDDRTSIERASTENAIIVYSHDDGTRPDIEIIDGWCTVEQIIRKKSSNFRGMKLCFELKWRLPEKEEEHEITSGELLISYRLIKASI